MKRAGNRTGREAKRRRRRHERRVVWSFERAGMTTNAALVDWPPLTVESLQETIDYLAKLTDERDDYTFRCYGLNFIPLPPTYIIKI